MLPNSNPKTVTELGVALKPFVCVDVVTIRFWVACVNENFIYYDNMRHDVDTANKNAPKSHPFEAFAAA